MNEIEGKQRNEGLNVKNETAGHAWLNTNLSHIVNGICITEHERPTEALSTQTNGKTELVSV